MPKSKATYNQKHWSKADEILTTALATAMHYSKDLPF